MIDSIYELLSQIGFTHPLHPAITHLPMGLVMGAFLFGIVSLKYEALAKTAHHCIVLALVFVLPTAFLGIMDWQHFYQGEWSTLIIIKFTLTVVLAALLAGAAILGAKKQTKRPFLIAAYALCLFNAIALGFTGGEIQYG